MFGSSSPLKLCLKCKGRDTLGESVTRLLSSVLVSSFWFCCSDDSKSRRTDVRIPRDNSLMVEGHHYGPADERKQEDRPAWEQKDLSSPSTISLDSGHSSITSRIKGLFSFKSRCSFYYVVQQPRRKVTTCPTLLAKCFRRLIFGHLLLHFGQISDTVMKQLESIYAHKTRIILKQRL